ncbi:MAG: hypothetical protein AABX88_02205 [Nanoarchaeota archaeon]
MTKEKPQTTEEREKERALNVKKTLEDKLLQSVMGSNAVLSNPYMFGQLGMAGGKSTYNSVTASEEFNKIRQKAYSETKAKYEQTGVYGEPGMLSNGDISAQMMQQIREVSSIAKLGELEKYVKSIGAKLDFEVPQELKNASYLEVLTKIQKEGRDKPKDKYEMTVLGLHQTLTNMYERACAVNAVQENYFTDLNDQGKMVLENYLPKKEEGK